MKTIGIVGGGRMGSMRAKICKDHGIFNTVIVEPVEPLREQLKKDGYNVVADIKEVIGKIDGLWISTPTQWHLPMIKIGAENGLHMYCEKPLTLSVERTIEAIRICEEKKVRLDCGWHKRFDREFTEVAEKMNKEEWYHIDIVNRDNPTPPDSILSTCGSIIADMSGHDLNYLLYLTGGVAPVEVSAQAGKSFGTSVKDALHMTFKYREGGTERVCTTQTTRSSADEYDQRLEVHGKGQKLIAMREMGTNGYSFPQRFADAFKNEMVYFSQILNAEDPFSIPYRTPLQEDISLIKLVAALEKSCYTKKTVYLDKNFEMFDPLTQPLSLRFVGYGGFGKFINEYVLKEVKEDFRILTPHVSRTSGLGFEDGVDKDFNYDAVYVATPDRVHDDHAIRCLKSGKHCLVEKPVDNFSVVGTQAKSSMLILMVGFMRRFDNQYLAAKKHCDEKLPKEIVIESYDPVPPEQDTFKAGDRNFVIGNSMSHDIDTLNWMFPESQIKVTKVTPQKDTGILMELTIIHKEEETTKVLIKFHKNDAKYVQKITCDGSVFGYDYDVKDGVSKTPFELYKDAYRNQFLHFKKLVRGELYEPNLIDSYEKTFSILDQAVKVSNEV